MDKLKYALLARVNGRGKADIIESFLRSEEIDVVLVQDAVSHVTHVTSFAPVQIFVPKASIQRARSLLSTYTKLQDNSKEKPDMANKKKIEERLAAERKARQARYIQIGGLAAALIVIVLGFRLFLPKGDNQSTDNQSIIVEGQTACENFSVIPVSDQYTTEPPMGIDVSKQFSATVKMANGGEFVIQLFPDKAPRTVNSFVFLACRGYFDGLTFHRVIEGFMAQGGDPTGTGTGGPGYQFDDEFSDLTFDKEGLLAMANSGPNTNGSQFFITFAPTPHLNNLHTIFGEVIEGMDVVKSITLRDPNSNPSFGGDAIGTIVITEQ
jgi:cyclophilin family peptidyl-prolyl cis-trans isomerase